MRTLASLIDFSQSSLLFVLSFQFLILHLFITTLRRTVVHKIGAFYKYCCNVNKYREYKQHWDIFALYITFNTQKMFKLTCLFY